MYGPRKNDRSGEKTKTKSSSFVQGLWQPQSFLFSFQQWQYLPSVLHSLTKITHFFPWNSTGRNGRHGIFALDDSVGVDEDCIDCYYYSLRVRHTTLISAICRELDALTVMTDEQTYELRYKGKLLERDGVETVGSMRIKRGSVLSMTNG